MRGGVFLRRSDRAPSPAIVVNLPHQSIAPIRRGPLVSSSVVLMWALEGGEVCQVGRSSACVAPLDWVTSPCDAALGTYQTRQAPRWCGAGVGPWMTTNTAARGEDSTPRRLRGADISSVQMTTSGSWSRSGLNGERIHIIEEVTSDQTRNDVVDIAAVLPRKDTNSLLCPLSFTLNGTVSTNLLRLRITRMLTNQNGTAHNCRPTSSETSIKNNWQSLVRDYVTQ